MDDPHKSDFGKKWICPNDRGLSLLARVGVGWSVKSQYKYAYKRPPDLSEEEKQVIIEVVKRAEVLDNLERERVGQIVQKFNSMKRLVQNDQPNPRMCVVCGERCVAFGIRINRSTRCSICFKVVCGDCSVMTIGFRDERLWTCKICFDQREAWKKTNHWLFHGLPAYVTPVQAETSSSRNAYYQRRMGTTDWADDSSTDDEDVVNRYRLKHKEEDDQSFQEKPRKFFNSLTRHLSQEDFAEVDFDKNGSKRWLDLGPTPEQLNAYSFPRRSQQPSAFQPTVREKECYDELVSARPPALPPKPNKFQPNESGDLTTSDLVTELIMGPLGSGVVRRMPNNVDLPPALPPKPYKYQLKKSGDLASIGLATEFNGLSTHSSMGPSGSGVSRQMKATEFNGLSTDSSMGPSGSGVSRQMKATEFNGLSTDSSMGPSGSGVSRQMKNYVYHPPALPPKPYKYQLKKSGDPTSIGLATAFNGLSIDSSMEPSGSGVVRGMPNYVDQPPALPPKPQKNQINESGDPTSSGLSTESSMGPSGSGVARRPTTLNYVDRFMYSPKRLPRKQRKSQLNESDDSTSSRLVCELSDSSTEYD